MKPFRILTVYLALAGLLLGNVAGWVHVGCASHQGDCCPSTPIVASKTTPDQSGHSCCHHHHDRDCQPESPAEQPESVPPAEQPDSNPHDSDRCSVCQSFFASRHAVVLAGDVTHFEPLEVFGDVVSLDDVFTPSQFSSGDTVRGPPSV